MSQPTEDQNKSHSQALGNLSLCWRVLYEPQRFYETVGECVGQTVHDINH